MKKDRPYQYSDDEELYEELLDQACSSSEEVLDASIDEILGIMAWQERIENRNESIFSTAGKVLNPPTKEEIEAALKKNWITDNSLN